MDMNESDFFGDILKNRRQERGLSLDEVSQQTRIRRQYLEALEEGNFDAFPGETYLKGFLRNYCEFLELDSGEIIAQYQQQKPAAAEGESELRRIETDLVEPVRRGPSSSPYYLLILVVVVIAVLAIAYFLLQEKNPRVPLPKTSAPAESIEPGQPTEPPPPADPDQPAGLPDPHPQNRGEAPLVPSPKKEIPQEVGAAPAAAPVSDQDSPKVFTSPLPQEGGTVKLQALEPTRLEIIVDGRPLQRYELRVGAALTWRIRESARLLIENPEGVDIWFQDHPLAIGGHSIVIFETAKDAESP